MNFTSGINVAEIDYTRINNAGTSIQTDQAFRGRAALLSDFGITFNQLSSIQGVRIDGGNRLDPSLIGIAIPEPGRAGLLAFGVIAILARRQR